MLFLEEFQTMNFFGFAIGVSSSRFRMVRARLAESCCPL